MVPAASASRWTSHYGVQAAKGLSTQPFAALRLLQTDIWPNLLKCPILMLISAEKPIGPIAELFVTLTASPSNAPREFQVTPWLNTNNKPLYLYTIPYFLEVPTEDGTLDDGWHSDFRIFPSDKERLSQIIESDFGKLSGYFKRAVVRYSGGEEPVQVGWDTWSAYSKLEGERRRPFQVYEHVLLEKFDEHNKPNIHHELACFKQLSRDYSWRGVTKVIEWIESARITASQPNSGPRPQLRFSRNQEDVCFALDSLQRIPIPYDSNPPQEPSSDSEDDDLDLLDAWSPPIPEFDVVIRRPSIPTAKVKVFAFDVFGTVLDRENALLKSIEFLLAAPLANRNPTDLHESERLELLELFVEAESIYSQENPSAGYEAVLQHALKTIAHRFGTVDLSEDTLRQATDLACSPHPFPEALSTLNSLSQQDYTIILLSPADEDVLSRSLGQDISLGVDLSQRIIHLPFMYSPLPDKSLNDLKELTSSIHPGIVSSQIVAVTTCVPRTVEPCASFGMPTVLVRRTSAIEPRLIPDSSTPTLEVADLSELSALLDVEAKPVTQSNRSDLYAESEEPQENILEDLSEPHRIAKLYQCTEVLGSGSFGTVEGTFHIYSGAAVAIKWELHYRKIPYALPYERAIYRLLGEQPWLPRIH